MRKDNIIVGAGLLGSSVAMHLGELSSGSILVIDVDLEGSLSSSELNAGGVRVMWNHPINVELSKISIDYYQSISSEIGFKQNGYFWMYSKENWERGVKSLKSNPHLKDLAIEYLTPHEISKKYSFIDKTHDLGGATFSPKDGLLNPNLLKIHYRKKAKAKGVEFLDRIWVHRIEFLDEQTIKLHCFRFPQEMQIEEIKKILMREEPKGYESISLQTKTLINCSGAWAHSFAKSMGTDCAAQAIRRQVSIFDCKEVDLTPFGMFVDSSGVYFHSEANHILAGFAVAKEPVGYNFHYDGNAFFEEYIWPQLFARSTKFESLKHLTGWAGLYEVSPDNSAIVGRVPGLKNVYEAHSFSGRGVMQSYAAGLGLTELMTKNRCDMMDLSVLSGDRFSRGEFIKEGMLI